MNGFSYTLTLLEPVLANSLGGEPNSAQSLYYIPGGLVRGAAINAYTGVHDSNAEEFRRLFLDGRTRYLNAYPLLADGRSLPTPLLYKKPKYFEASDFGLLQADHIQAVEDVFQINVHTQRDAERGRATAEAGAVYRYIALPAGLRLQGAILAENAQDAALIKNLLDGASLLLGKARTAGYGRVKIEFESLADDWSETTPAMSLDNQKFTMTLLSPAIVRDANGQCSLDIKPALEARLGIPVKEIKAAAKPEIVGGYNRTWGLPLPQVTAIAAGSVFTVTTQSPLSPGALENLAASGLGERRAEGFGRLAVNLSLPKPDEVKEEDWKLIAAPIENLSTSAGHLGANPTAQLMLKRLLRRELDAKVLHFAREATKTYSGGVPNSQLSRWRVIVRNALEQRDLPRLQKFCETSKGKPGWKKMEKARLTFGDQRPRLTEWIESVLEKPETLWPALGLAENEKRRLGTNSLKVEDFNVEYRLRLLDAVLALLAKQNGGQNG